MSITAVLLYLLANLFAFVTLSYLIYRIGTYPLTPVHRALAATLIVLAVMVGSNTLSMVSPTVGMAEFLHRTVRMVAIALIAPAFTLFLLIFSESRLGRTPPFLFLVFAISATSLTLIFTNPLHHLYTTAYSFRRVGPFYLRASWEPGPWFGPAALYGFLLMFLCILYCGYQFSHSTGTKRTQYGVFAVAAASPTLFSILDTYQIAPPEFQFSTIGMALVGVVVYWSMREFRIVDLLPVAWETVVESMRDAVVVVDNDMAIRALNPAAAALLDIKQSDIGLNILSLLVNNPHLAEYQDAHRVGHDEIEVLRSSGAVEYYDLTITTVGGKPGTTIGRALILRDITERKSVEREREQLLQELQAYAHTVAHDLKAPLGAVTGFLDVALMEESIEPPEVCDYITRSRNMGKKMAEIIDSLLLFASLRDEETDASFEKLDMQRIADDALDRVATLVQEFKPEVKMPEQWPEAIGYGPWIEEVWMNLLSNAIKYGGRPPVIEIEAESQPPNVVCYKVRDNGPGVPADQLGDLFVPWERLNHAQSEGHGLGLSICRRIIERHGGEMGVEPGNGQGSTFTFTLPGRVEESAGEA